MGLQVRPDTGEVGVKRRYRVTNCAAYVVNAIRASLTIKTLLQLPDRATLVLHESLLRLGQADLPLPVHTCFLRRVADSRRVERADEHPAARRCVRVREQAPAPHRCGHDLPAQATRRPLELPNFRATGD